MPILLKALIQGFYSQGYEDLGGNADTYIVMRKDDNFVNIKANDNKEPHQSFVVESKE